MKIRKNLFKLSGGKYLVTVKTGKKRFRRRFDDRLQAESFLAKILDRRAADRFEDEGFQYPKETADLEVLANAPESLGELMERFQKEYTKKNGLPKRSKGRDAISKAHLKTYFEKRGPLPLSVLTRAGIEAYMEHRKAEVSPSTVNHEIAYLKKVMTWALRRDWIKQNPALAVRKYEEGPKKWRILSPAEFNRLLECADEEKAPHLGFILRLLYTTGMRKGEALGLLWDEVNFTNGTIELPGERTKTGRPRGVPLDQLSLETLKDMYSHRQHEKFVFFHRFYATRGRKKGKIKSGRILEIKRAFHTACKKAKLEGLRIHDLRHTASTYTVKRHGIAKAQALLGHADIKTTQLYTHFDVEDLRQAVEDQASGIEEAPKPFYIEPLEKGATKGPSPA